MKKINKSLILLFLFMIFLTTGCKKKDNVTADQFKKYMEKKGYVIVNKKDNIYNNKYFNNVYYAVEKEEKYTIQFFELKDEASSKVFYNNLKKDISNSKVNKYKENSKSISNYSYYELSYNNNYKKVSRINNTIIYINTDIAYSKIINRQLKNLEF